MDWKTECIQALEEENMFESPGHRTRFKELLDCYGKYPFFTRGLCKCMFLSAWDEEHFCIIIETLNELSIGQEHDTSEMSSKGDSLANELTDDEGYMYEFSLALLNDLPFRFDPGVPLKTETKYKIRRGLQASDIIDHL